MRTNKIKCELDEIERIEYAIVRHYLKYKTSKNLFDFQKFKAINVFGNSILSGEITITEADEKQSNLLNDILEFNDEAKKKKSDTYESVIASYEVREFEN